MSATQQLAEWAVGQYRAELPDTVSVRVKLAMLDFLGVALAGLDLPAATLIRGLVAQQGGSAESTALGLGPQVPAPQAALANGTSGHALDMDDGHRLAGGHPGVTVIPAGLAAAELVDAAVSDLWRAVAIGYEIMIRIASAINPAHLERGFHTTGTVGPFGAATAAGLLLGLDPAGLANALGAAASNASGLFQVLHEGAMLKPVHAGRAAQSGVFSALYARAGGEAPRHALDGADGFLRAYADMTSTDALTDCLGKSWAILGMYFKLHSACRHVHAAVDAIMDLVARHELRPEMVEAVDVRTYAVAERMTGRKGAVTDVPTARFSLPFCLALAAIRGSVGPAEFTDEAIRAPELHDFARRVSVREDPQLTALYPHERGADVAVTLVNGQQVAARVMFPRGEPEHPLTWGDCLRKFTSNAEPVLGGSGCEEVAQSVWRLDHESVRSFMASVNAFAAAQPTSVRA